MSKKDIIINITNGYPNRLRESYFIKNNKEIYNDIIEYIKFTIVENLALGK